MTSRLRRTEARYIKDVWDVRDKSGVPAAAAACRLTDTSKSYNASGKLMDTAVPVGHVTKWDYLSVRQFGPINTDWKLI